MDAIHVLTAFVEADAPSSFDSSCPPTKASEQDIEKAHDLLQRTYGQDLTAATIARFKDDLPTNDDICELNNILGVQNFMNYQEFLKASHHLSGPLRQRYFLASTFDKFAKERDSGSVDVEDFLKYVQRSVDVERVQLELASHAASTSGLSRGSKGSCGSITEQELEQFVLASIARTPLVAEFSPPLHADFLPFFVFTAVRRFLFFLDPMRTRSINIKKLAHSQVMDEFLWLQRLHQYREDYESESAFQQQVAGNWFSAQNAIKLYDQYVELDVDGDGMLSEVELLKYHGSSRAGRGDGVGVQLTPVVISRLFQENITYAQPPGHENEAPKMDYKTFLDLALALECREHVQSLRYFWRVLDIHHDGLLHTSTIDFFFRDIRKMLLERGYESCPHASDVITEVMDMLGEDGEPSRLVPSPSSPPNSPPRNRRNDALGYLPPVTFKRMVASGQATTVIAMLIDIHKFWAYDNRESLGSGSGDEDEDEQEEETPPPSASSGDSRSNSGDMVETSRTFGSPSTTSSVSQPRPSFGSLEPGSMDDDDPYDF